MPSMKKLFFFSKKKSHHNQGQHKFQEFYGYDNLRNPSASSNAHYLAPPIGHHQHQLYQNGLAQAPPPHSFSHPNRHLGNNNLQHHHIYSQQYLQQQPVSPQSQQAHLHQPLNQSHLQQQPQQSQQHLTHNGGHILSSPMPIPMASPPTSPSCQCQACSLTNQQQQPMANGNSNHQQQFIPCQPPVHTANSTFQQQQQQQQHQTLPQQTHLIQAQPPNQIIQHQHNLQRMQPHSPPDQQTASHPMQQHQNQPYTMNGINSNNIMQQQHSTSHAVGPNQQVSTVGCSCQHCPYQQQLIQQQQQQHQSLIGQQSHFNDSNGASCQHQTTGNQLNGHPDLHQQYHTIGHLVQHQHQPQQVNGTPTHHSVVGSLMHRSTSPNAQHSHQQQHPQIQCQTLQPQLYQQQKQQMHQQFQQHHQRVQSLHQQPIAQFQSHPHLNQSVSAQSQHQLNHQCDNQLESDGYSRYANWRTMQSILLDVNSLPHNKTNGQHFYDNHQQSDNSHKFQEHVYCNQKPEFLLPAYQLPPSYKIFMERRKTGVYDNRSQHLTHNSEMSVWNRTKDSSYENLRSRVSPYSSLDITRQDAGLTT